ncbi:hypothetical protein B0H16DRAFT_553840 [Mycena metata]|uniref:Uncharacterized protein n=1 Tax=Mycena metata TaxID=1033252 RepID=A0AAD7H5R0_9AGAR|nr:hypothetical protein B0H16DRAFT_553840 [Mycena metata]
MASRDRGTDASVAVRSNKAYKYRDRLCSRLSSSLLHLTPASEMVHINQEVSRAVEECVDSAEYKPPSLPTVDGPDWAPLLATPPTDHAAILANQGMCTQGKEVFSFVTFFLMSDNIRGRPAGMLQTIRDSVSSPAILKRVMKKTDPRLLRNGVNNVTDGFYTLLGHFWEIQDLSTMVKWLDHILGPLITAATAAYLKHYEPPRAKQAPKARKNDTESNKAAAHRMSDDILFLTNLRDLQLDSSDSENSSGSDMSVGEVPRVLSPPAIPAFGSWPLSPLNLGALSKSTRGSFAAPSDPHIPSDELYRHWVSLPGPSYIEFELGLPEPEEYRQNERTMAAMQGLLPPLEIEAVREHNDLRSVTHIIPRKFRRQSRLSHQHSRTKNLGHSTSAILRLSMRSTASPGPATPPRAPLDSGDLCPRRRTNAVESHDAP